MIYNLHILPGADGAIKSRTNVRWIMFLSSGGGGVMDIRIEFFSETWEEVDG
jgi:hypothetical protein